MVVAIIGILAALIIVSITSAAAKARDIKRQEDLRNIQKALEMYYTSNGSYPNNNNSWTGVGCSNNDFNRNSCPGGCTISGPSGYIPNLAPTYIPVLPLDPRNGIIACTTTDTYGGGCYLYRSDGSDYAIIAYESVEVLYATQTNQYSQFYWDSHNVCQYGLYTPGAISKGW
ncbi:type II secretion system protein GspG [Patescibacteria group bacterium]|nr:type II secretion system protein GspG [Patescibacteria group bacterium]